MIVAGIDIVARESDEINIQPDRHHGRVNIKNDHQKE